MNYQKTVLHSYLQQTFKHRLLCNHRGRLSSVTLGIQQILIIPIVATISYISPYLQSPTIRLGSLSNIHSDAMAPINRRHTDLTEMTSSSSGSSLHSRSSSESLGAPSDTTAPSIHEDDFGRADDPTAIVGLACRLPGAQSSSKLWENILEQKDLQSKIPADRFTVDEFYHPNGANKGTVRFSSCKLSYVADEL